MLSLGLALARAQVPAFQHDVLPLFENRCNSCHGKTKSSGLDMRSLDALMASGATGPVVVPGKPEASFLSLSRKFSSDDPGSSGLGADLWRDEGQLRVEGAVSQ